MIAARSLSTITSIAVVTAAVVATTYAGDIPPATGFAIALAHVVLVFFMVDVFGEYAMCYPAGVFSCVAFLLWGPGIIPWALAGVLGSCACQYGAWRAGVFLPAAQLRAASEGSTTLLGVARFVLAGSRILADWFSGMAVALVPYRLCGGLFPATVASWGSLAAALGFLLIVNFVWLGISQVRAAHFRSLAEEIPPPSFQLFARALLGLYVTMPGTVLVLFTVQQFQEKGSIALLFWTAATLPFHFVARALFASSYAQYEAEREEDRQRQAVMLASQASMILHEIVHQIGALNLLLHLPEGSSGSALGEARSHVRQLERTIENFRVSLRRHEMERQLVQVEGLVEQALAACSVGDHGPVAVKYEEGAAACDVFGDPFLLSSALGNVLRNALEASPTESPVELHVARRDEAAVAISIRDHGPGVDRADRERVFEPSFSTKGRGLGLGLHLAREIVRSHAGRVNIGETGGGGTTVTVVLPTIPKRSL